MVRLSATLMLILFVLFSVGNAENKNWYFLVDREIREVYEYYEAQSLKDAIDELIQEESSMDRGQGEVSVGFKSGLFIGTENILEIKVQNNTDIQVANMEFQFTFPDNPSIDFVPDYGDISPDGGPQDMIRIHPEAFNLGGDHWATSARFFDYPERLLIAGYKGVDTSLQHPLPARGSLSTLYSMQIYIPYDTSLVGEAIIIDNVNIDPGCSWFFEEIGPPVNQYPPLFQGNWNASINDPSAPPDTFTIGVDPLCESDLDLEKSAKSGKAALRDAYEFLRNMHESMVGDNSRRLKNPGEYFGLRYRDGIRYVSAKIKYDGLDEELTNLGVKILPYRVEGYDLNVYIPLSILPELCQLEGVREIYPTVKGSPRLDHSTVDVKCNYHYLQDTLGTSGDSIGGESVINCDH